MPNKKKPTKAKAACATKKRKTVKRKKSNTPRMGFFL